MEFQQQVLISDGHISNGQYRKFGDIRFTMNAFKIFGVFHRILRKMQRNTLNVFQVYINNKSKQINKHNEFNQLDLNVSTTHYTCFKDQ